MSKLVALELFNFKSYKGHHVIQLGDSYFTSIIGPNGSGKSNSMDAISFVLGIKSSHLRSTHLKDLVYRGRVLKRAKINADGDANEAELGALDLEDDDDASDQEGNAPSTAWVMAIYDDDAGAPQHWRRSITSAGTSTYHINSRLVSAAAYNSALEAENILIRARNFLVFQGDVESIANQNPKDLTRLIEQISGSGEYRLEYERLRAEKEKADEEQSHRLNQRRGINGEVKLYQQRKEELDKYESTRDERDASIVTHVLWKLYHFQRLIEDSAAEIQKHQDELKEFRRNVQKFEDKLAEAQREQAKSLRDVSKAERELKRKEKTAEEKEHALVPLDEKLSISRKNLLVYRKRIEEVTAERDAQQATIAKMQKDLSAVQKAEKRWETEWSAQQQQQGREVSEADLQEYQRLRAEVYKRSGDDQLKLDNLTRQLKTDEETVASLSSKVDSLHVQIASLEAETAALASRKTDLTATITATSTAAADKRTALHALASERERTNQKHRELDEKLGEVLRKLVDAQSYQRESHKDTATRETVAQMKRIFPGVRGLMNTLCKPKQKKYEAAVVTVLGRHWDSVVVDSEKCARECMGYLKDQRGGQMTFVPLDTIIHQNAGGRELNLRGVQGVRMAIDTLDFEPAVARAISFACGNAVVTDTLAIARTLCYEKNVEAKAVALDGSVIHKGGNMTGGTAPGDGRQRKFEDAEVENLRVLAEKFKADIEALPRGHKRQAEEEALQGELVGLDGAVAYAREELTAVERNLASKNKEVQFARSTLEEVEPRFEEQREGVETLKAALEEHKAAIAEVEDEVFADWCAKTGYGDVREYEVQQGSLQAEARVKRMEFTQQIKRLETQLGFERGRVEATVARLQGLQTKQERDEAVIAGLEEEREGTAEELDEVNAEIDVAREALGELRGVLEQKGKVVGEARREVGKRGKGVEKAAKAVAGLESEMERAGAERYGVLRRCRVEGLKIPLENGSRKLDSLPLEDAVLDDEADDPDAMDIDGQEGSTKPVTVKDYGIFPSYDDLEDDLKEDPSPECEANLLDATATLTASLEKMAPNMRSADRLATTSDRLKTTERAFTASRTAAKSATKAFETVRDKRSALFTKAYTHIAAQLPGIYRALTKTASFPLGGTASLDAEEDEAENEPYLSGIKYHAMPPLKRFRDMSSLSGGEKTMAALALLFAVHTYAPSPFFVLDEVDAALDVQNTSQLARYVESVAGPGMQFVVISLKAGVYERGEGLVGVMRDQGMNSSKCVTLDVSFPCRVCVCSERVDC